LENRGRERDWKRERATLKNAELRPRKIKVKISGAQGNKYYIDTHASSCGPGNC
jgi:hypothetical protein